MSECKTCDKATTIVALRKLADMIERDEVAYVRSDVIIAEKTRPMQHCHRSPRRLSLFVEVEA